MNLDDLRQRLTSVDEEILRLVGERQRLASTIGEFKREAGIPTRDWQREKQVLEHFEVAHYGLAPNLAFSCD